MTVTPISTHTSRGSSTLPGKRPSKLTHCTTSPFLSLSRRRQGGGVALWLLSRPLLPGKEEGREGRKRTAGEGSSVATPAAGGQQCGALGVTGEPSLPLCEGLGQAQGEPREAAAIHFCSRSSSVCRCLIKSHPRVTK